MGSLLIGARILLVVVFATAGVAKLLDWRGTRTGLAGFGVPTGALAVAAVVLPLAELGTAVALVFPTSAQWGGLAALFLLLAFVAGIARAMRQGRAPDCHCFGQLHSAPAGRGTLVRNLVLAVPAGLVAVEGPGPSVSAWAGDRTAAELVAIAAVVAAAVLGALAVRFWRESVALRRELDDARAELQALPPGLPVGTLAPGFTLRSARTGEPVTLEALCAGGRPVALVFVSPSCGSCAGIFADAGRWQNALAGDLTVAIVSDGAPGENLIVVQDSSADVLLQEDWEVGKAYKVAMTPTAVVVSPQGRIASALVSGPGIESLVRLTVRQNSMGSVGAPPAQRVA
jgi:hypothetical protein